MTEVLPAEVKPDTEIRKLPSLINRLIPLLELNDGWKKLMSEIRPREDYLDLNDEDRKYNHDDIRAVSDAGDKDRSCTEIFFDEWGTSGRKRPTVKILYDYLREFGFIRAANHIGTNYLNLPEIEEPLEPLPEATVEADESVDCSRTVYDTLHNRSTEKYAQVSKMYILQNAHEYDETESVCSAFSVNSEETTIEQSINPEILSTFDDKIDKKVERIPYEELKTITRNFDRSCKLGAGAFGSVYLGKLKNVDLAVKVLETGAIEHFERELIILSGDIKHPRLLAPVAVSINEIPCLIYPYMPHGSLADRLAQKLENLLPLRWQKRIMIASNIIEGLHYLHTRPQPIVHRDIKTSNILLDEADLAKIGDFGLIREKKEGSISIVDTVQGTDAYMAPEAFRYISSTKLDVFSYGMVLLELLTGLPIIDEDRGHLKEYVEEELEEENDITKLLDVNAGRWPREIANELFSLANNCLEMETKRRYDSDDVVKCVNNLIEKIVAS